MAPPAPAPAGTQPPMKFYQVAIAAGALVTVAALLPVAITRWKKILRK